MWESGSLRVRRITKSMQSVLMGPQLLAFLPALTLGGYWYGGEGVLLFIAVVLPALFAMAGVLPDFARSHFGKTDGVTGLKLRRSILAALEKVLSTEKTSGRQTACFVIEIDDFAETSRVYGPEAANDLLRSVGRRLASTLREADTIARLEKGRFAIALGAMRRADLEGMIQVASRLQASVADPFSVDGTKVFLSITIGFSLPTRVPQQTAIAYLEAAQAAQQEARSHGPGSIRAYSDADIKIRATRAALLDEIEEALENGQIRPWFQPQICTDTGKINGFEALARWVHPVRGTISPADFLPAIREAGLFERLGEVMMTQSLTAQKAWDNAGYSVPTVGVNFSSIELGNPKLCDKVRWELDRYDLAPERLTVEILEDVIAQSSNDTITRNINALSKMGCKIDLDDFGTGHASIANIRRFKVDRIKIDRSYVTRVDRDREQQDMVAAILTMAERLGLETLAEGVETPGEYSMLAQLGCGNVQGFSIARPMSFEDTFVWMKKHHATLAETPRIDRQAS